MWNKSIYCGLNCCSLRDRRNMLCLTFLYHLLLHGQEDSCFILQRRSNYSNLLYLFYCLSNTNRYLYFEVLICKINKKNYVVLFVIGKNSCKCLECVVCFNTLRCLKKNQDNDGIFRIRLLLSRDETRFEISLVSS